MAWSISTARLRAPIQVFGCELLPMAGWLISWVWIHTLSSLMGLPVFGWYYGHWTLPASGTATDVRGAGVDQHIQGSQNLEAAWHQRPTGSQGQDDATIKACLVCERKGSLTSGNADPTFFPKTLNLLCPAVSA